MDNICQKLEENGFQYQNSQYVIIYFTINKYIKWCHIYVFNLLYFLDVKFDFNSSENDKIESFCKSEHYDYYSYDNYTKRVYGPDEIIHDLKMFNKKLKF